MTGSARKSGGQVAWADSLVPAGGRVGGFGVVGDGGTWKRAAAQKIDGNARTARFLVEDGDSSRDVP